MSKCIFYGPLTTPANHFSIVSRGTKLALMFLYPSEGFRERSGPGVLNLGDRASVGVGAPPPRPSHNPQEKGPAFRVRYV